MSKPSRETFWPPPERPCERTATRRSRVVLIPAFEDRLDRAKIERRTREFYQKFARALPGDLSGIANPAIFPLPLSIFVFRVLLVTTAAALHGNLYNSFFPRFLREIEVRFDGHCASRVIYA